MGNREWGMGNRWKFRSHSSLLTSHFPLPKAVAFHNRDRLSLEYRERVNFPTLLNPNFYMPSREVEPTVPVAPPDATIELVFLIPKPDWYSIWGWLLALL